MRDFLRSITPGFLLAWYRKRKKGQVRRDLEVRRQQGRVITTAFIEQQLRENGIVEGDCILVHSKMSSMGYLEEGPKTLVDAVLNVIGPSGHLLMPTTPSPARQKDYADLDPVFDVRNSPSALGAIGEYFRTLPGVVRSLHPTEPVSAFGPRAHEFVSGHFGELTPYTFRSPFHKVAENNGKILYIGVALANAGTSLHTLEDAVDFKYPVYYHKRYKLRVIDYDGKEHTVETLVHNPEWSDKRRCDQLIPRYLNLGVMKRIRIGEAETYLTDARLFFDTMVRDYHEKGITMYTPHGSQ